MRCSRCRVGRSADLYHILQAVSESFRRRIACKCSLLDRKPPYRSPGCNLSFYNPCCRNSFPSHSACRHRNLHRLLLYRCRIARTAWWEGRKFRRCRRWCLWWCRCRPAGRSNCRNIRLGRCSARHRIVREAGFCRLRTKCIDRYWDRRFLCGRYFYRKHACTPYCKCSLRFHCLRRYRILHRVLLFRCRIRCTGRLSYYSRHCRIVRS